MAEYTDLVDDLYCKAQSGEPRVIVVPVSDDLDLIVYPLIGDTPTGLIRLVDADGEVVIWPSEVRNLIYYLVEAAVTLAEWKVFIS